MIDFEQKLKEIKNSGLYREMRYLDDSQKPDTIVDGKKMLLMASNNYLGLCDDIRLKQAIVKAVSEYGVGSGGSRLTTGSYALHYELEQRLAKFKKTEGCLLFSTGYAANVGTISAIVDKDWVIFCDRLNHASIIDGCRLSGAKLVVYKHCDMGDLESKIKKYNNGNGIIITDSVFSMDGNIAPVDKIVSIAKRYNVMTMVDDAHATGVLGNRGAGIADYFGLESQIDIQMGTLSKAFASEGGYIAGKKDLIDYVRHRAKSFIYSTAPAPHNMAVSLKVLDIIKREPDTRKDLLEKSMWLRKELLKNSFQVQLDNTPIIPIMIGEVDKAVEISRVLYRYGIWVPAIRPPTVPKGSSRLRISIMATHSYEELTFVVETLTEVAKKFEII